MILIFTRNSCEECEEIKNLFDLGSLDDVEEKLLPEAGKIDPTIDEEEAIGDADYYGVEGTPSLVIDAEKSVVVYGPDDIETIISFLEDIENGTVPGGSSYF
jgi:glutaredoxin